MEDISSCTAFSTCQKADRKTTKLKACWDTMNKLEYDTETKLFCKEAYSIVVCYDLGECECGELYLEKGHLSYPFTCWLCD
jgi:hypothetical protein